MDLNITKRQFLTFFKGVDRDDVENRGRGGEFAKSSWSRPAGTREWEIEGFFLDGRLCVRARRQWRKRANAKAAACRSEYQTRKIWISKIRRI